MAAIVSPAPAQPGPPRRRNLRRRSRNRIARVSNNSNPRQSVLHLENGSVPGRRRTRSRSGTATRADKEDVMHNFLKTAGAATLMGVLTMAGVAAEAGQIRATVPFSFEVNKQVLAPGTYTIDSSVAHGLVVRGAKSGAIVLGAPLSSRDSSPRLVFHRYGNEYILREVWM